MQELKSLARATAVAMVGLALAGPGLGEDFDYRDALGDRTGKSEDPLIPPAALGRAPDRPQTPPAVAEGDGDMIPLAHARGSQAAEIYQRNQRRVEVLSRVFGRMKERIQAEEREVAEDEAQRRRQDEGMRDMLEAQPGDPAAHVEPPPVAEPDRAAVREPGVGRGEAAVREEIAQRRLTGEGSPEGVPAGVYVVERGDSLSAISRKVYGDPTLWKQLMAANGMTERSILRPGDRLQVPPAKGLAAAAGAAPAAPLTPRRKAAAAAPDEQVLDYARYEYKLYNIQNGDTLSAIAQRWLGDAGKQDLLKAVNAKVVERGLKAGDKLLIPIPKSPAHQERYLKSREGVFD